MAAPAVTLTALNVAVESDFVFRLLTARPTYTSLFMLMVWVPIWLHAEPFADMYAENVLPFRITLTNAGIVREPVVVCVLVAPLLCRYSNPGP